MKRNWRDVTLSDNPAKINSMEIERRRVIQLAKVQILSILIGFVALLAFTYKFLQIIGGF